MKFSKVLAKYYIKWFRDCHDSAVYCMNRGDELRAKAYLASAAELLIMIQLHWDAIEFFSIGDNAHKIDRYLPVEFQGYE